MKLLIKDPVTGRTSAIEAVPGIPSGGDIDTEGTIAKVQGTGQTGATPSAMVPCTGESSNPLTATDMIDGLIKLSFSNDAIETTQLGVFESLKIECWY